MFKHRHGVTEHPGQLAAIAIGIGAIGFALGALLSARTGQENRAAVKERLRSIGNRSKATKADVASRASEAKDFMVEAVKEVDSDETAMTDAPDKDLPEK